MSFSDFVLAQLPSASSRVLEVGCGDGTLALELAEAGYDVLAIDPVAPEGEIFRRTTLEELDEPGPFTAVVASRSLHHVHDLDAGLDRIVALLEPGGLLLVDEFAPDRLDARHGRLVVRAAARGRGRARQGSAAHRSRSSARSRPASTRAHHGYDAMRPALDARFDERSFSWEPYLYRELAASPRGPSRRR